MPQVSTNSPKNAVTPIYRLTAENPVYTVARDDTYVSIQANEADAPAQPGQPLPRTPTIGLPIGATVRLPGPTTDPANLPSNGDYYNVADPLGRIGVVSAGTQDFLTVDGGGYGVQGDGTMFLTAAMSEASFVFDDAGQVWIVCVCVPT